MNSPVIACLTDFGQRDAFAGILKAVALGGAPASRWIDLTHEILPGDVRHAALLAWQTAPFLPEGSILLAVVDPGVGSARRPIAIAFDCLLAIGPDNGLFSYLALASPPRSMVEIRPNRIDLPHLMSRTFHGRDLFAVAAARLATGSPVDSLGDPIAALTPLPSPRLEHDPERGTLTGEVIHFDHFGNALTSIGALQRENLAMHLRPWLRQFPPLTFPAQRITVSVGEVDLPLLGTYADAPRGAPLAYIGSSGLLEIAVHGGRADEVLGLRLDDRLQLCYKG